jgi:hypothetical protein
LSDVHILCSRHHRLRISALLSVIRGLAFAALQRVLDLWSSQQTVFVESGRSRWIFSSAVPCAAIVLYFSIQCSIYDDLFLSVLIFVHSSS